MILPYHLTELNHSVTMYDTANHLANVSPSQMSILGIRIEDFVGSPKCYSVVSWDTLLKRSFCAVYLQNSPCIPTKFQNTRSKTPPNDALGPYRLK